MATTATLTQVLLHRHIFRPLYSATTVSLSLYDHPKKPSFSLLQSQIRPLSSFKPLFCSFEENNNNLILNNNVEENEDNPESKILEIEPRELPNLTVKEKKDLCSYANSLGDKLKSQQVGKSGVTGNVVFALSETLEKNELLKLKIHRTCPGELEDVVRQLELATGSVVVGQIGRTVIFYRPSITKLKAEKKKEQNRKLFAQRREKAQTAFTKREQFTRRPGRGPYENRRSEKVAS
ncbi:unnamed protein product [Amaranthus hypochondriacus]